MTIRADREEAIYEALRPFRTAASSLSCPAQNAFDEIDAMDDVLLSVLCHPSIIEFSPFDTLAQSSSKEESILESPHERASSRIESLSPGRNPDDRKSAPSDRSSSGRTSSMPNLNDTKNAPPVFSLRRRESSDTNRRDSRSAAHDIDSKASSAGRLHNASYEPARKDLASPVQDAARQSRAERPSSMIREMKPVHGDDGFRQGFNPNQREKPSQTFEAISGSALGLINSLADSLLSPNREAVDRRRQPEAASSTRRNLQSVEGVSSAPDRGLNSIETGGDSIKQLEAMADELLLGGQPYAPQSTSIAGQLEQAGEGLIRGSSSNQKSDGQSVDNEVTNRLLNDLDVFSIDEQNAMWPPKEHVADIETVAYLVNEAIIEQARRHGVDLS